MIPVFLIVAGFISGPRIEPASLHQPVVDAARPFREAGGGAPERDEILKKIEHTYSKVKALSMSFEQLNAWSDMPEAGEVSKGRLWAAGGKRIRMEYSEPPGHMLVSDGVRVWVYVPENEQAVVDSLGGGEGAALAEMILSFLSEGRVRFLGEEEVRGRDCYVLLVDEVKSPPGLESVRIWVDPETWLARGLELRDVNGNLTSFVFWNVKKLDKVDDDLFVFRAPPGVEIVESPLSGGAE